MTGTNNVPDSTRSLIPLFDTFWSYLDSGDLRVVVACPTTRDLSIVDLNTDLHRLLNEDGSFRCVSIATSFDSCGRVVHFSLDIYLRLGYLAEVLRRLNTLSARLPPHAHVTHLSFSVEESGSKHFLIDFCDADHLPDTSDSA